MFELEQPEDDGFFIPKAVGSWSRDKHHFLRRYIDAFLMAMKDKPWGELHYIDLFAGAGMENVKGSGLDWGSPLIAAQHPVRFSRMHLCEIGRKKHRALDARLQKYAQPQSPQLLHGDANVEVENVVAQIPSDSLSLAFLDPYGLHLHFQTLRVLARRRVDLVILFPDHMDALRNWEALREGELDPRLDQVLGTDKWRRAAETTAPDHLAQLLSEIYQEQIGNLGYTHFDYERITRPRGGWLYRLIFCAKHRFAADLWARCAVNRPGGQRGFDFTSG
jgi:three-Cys-motif partner protein